MKNLLFLALFGLFFVACDSDSDVEGDWGKSRMEFGGGQRVGAASFTDKDGNVYVCMGYNPEVKQADKNLTDFWKFENGTWRQLPDFPAKGRYASVAFVIGDKAYVGAGYRESYGSETEDVYFSDFYCFDLTKEEWVKKTDGTNDYWTTDIKNSGFNAKECAFYGGVAFSLNGKGYAGTGQLDDRITKIVYCYDPAADKWTDAKFEGESRSGGSILHFGDRIVLCLGTNGSDFRRDVWVFDGTTWTEKRRLADVDGKWNDDYDEIPREYAATFMLDFGGLKGFVAGGSGLRNSRACWEYNIEKDRWYEATKFPSNMGPRIAGVGFAYKNRGYVTLGGSNRLTPSTTSTWEFIPGIDEDEDNDY